MDFACESIDVEQVLKCSFGLTKAGCAVMRSLMDEDWMTSEQIASHTGYDLATAQRSLKHLTDRGVVERVQHNRDGGGYEFVYCLVEGEQFVDLVDQTLDDWVSEAKQEVRQWTQSRTALK